MTRLVYPPMPSPARPTAPPSPAHDESVQRALEKRRVEPLTRDRLQALSQEEHTEVYEYVYDKTFEPFPADRVRGCVRQVSEIARNAASKDDARAAALSHPHLAEFSQCYQTMFDRLCDPSIASNPSHVQTVYAMIDVHDRMVRGTLSEDAARGEASSIALAGLMRQTDSAPPIPPEMKPLVEELD